MRPAHTLRSSIDPRRSLVAAIIWLVIALAASFAAGASWWAGRVARQIVVAQHVRRLLLETDQLGADLGEAISARLAAIEAAAAAPAPASPLELFQRLRTAYPAQSWTAFADADGRLLAGGKLPAGSDVSQSAWFAGARAQPWIGVMQSAPDPGRGAAFGDLAVPVREPSGRLVGIATSHLTWRWVQADLERLAQNLNSRGSALTLLLDSDGWVRVGPPAWIGRRWTGTATPEAPPVDATTASVRGPQRLPRFERVADRGEYLVAEAPLLGDDVLAAAGWRVQLCEPRALVYERANALAERILWISACLGAATAVFGALIAHRLTDRLRRLTRSAAAVGRGDLVGIEIPTGKDEVAQLGAVLAKVLDDLRQERSELLALSGELERRVAIRTREVERLAGESRYAAVVRERLKIARDLHDTLAHSMMAMLSEVRLLRRLHLHDPPALADELARAEQVAHAGLIEARTAITQMRVDAVRDVGLGAALAKAFDRFLDRTGLAGAFSADPEAAHFGDERAETLFRIAEEALRNVERHAQATKVAVRLTMRAGTVLELAIEDDGIGFNPADTHPGHFGLLGMREQAQLIAADLRFDSAPQHGTLVTVTLRAVPEAPWPDANTAV